MTEFPSSMTEILELLSRGSLTKVHLRLSRRTYAIITRQRARLDGVFAEASTGQLAPYGKIAKEHYDAIIDVNVKGLLFIIQKALALMRDGGAIILNASTNSSKGPAAWSVYSAAKAA